MKYLVIILFISNSFLTSHEVLAKKPLFANNTPIYAVLSAPIRTIYQQKKKDVRLYHQGTFSYRDANDANQKLKVKVRTRGNFRRRTCTYPPLRLNFARKENKETLFEKQNKLKLVGQCKKGERYQELLNLEYLVYKIWQQVSDYHFKTRLIKLSYIDTAGNSKPWTATTFVIEDVDDVAKRSKRKLLDVKNVARQQMNLAQTALLELFQLLIGNSDYSTLTGSPGRMCCHNARLITLKTNNLDVIPIPYDFDVSGFVNAPYASPASQYPIKNVRQRYYTGWCKEDRHTHAAIARFNQQKQVIYQQVQNSGLLSDRTLKNTTNYLDSFYRLINSEDQVAKEIFGRCRGKLIQG